MVGGWVSPQLFGWEFTGCMDRGRSRKCGKAGASRWLAVFRGLEVKNPSLARLRRPNIRGSRLNKSFPKYLSKKYGSVHRGSVHAGK